MPGEVVIREAVPADRRAVLSIATAGMREFGLEPDFDGVDADLGHIGEPQPHVVAALVAEVDGAIRGSVVLTAESERVGKVSGLYVDPGARGRGIGRALLEAAVAAGRERGLARVHLETWGAMRAAVRLYESSGWVRGAHPPERACADRVYWLDLARAAPRDAAGAADTVPDGASEGGAR